MKYIIYDAETLKDFISFCFKDYKTGQKKQFYLHGDNRSQLDELYKFLISVKKNNYYLVGFNNIAFDAQIVEYILYNYGNDWRKERTDFKTIIENIYDKSQRIINLSDEDKFKVLIPEWKLSIPQIDLFKQKHYDRPQKATSLKWLQFTMWYPTVEEMPLSHDASVAVDQIESIFEYNWNDVESTSEFFKQIYFETELRDSLSTTYNLNLMNASEPKMVREIFGKLLCEEMNISYKELKKQKTKREEVVIKDIIFPYINFSTDTCNQVLSWFTSTVVHPDSPDESKQEKIEHKFKFAQCDSVVALGGIHGCIKSGRYKSTDTNIIHDIDVVSFYPNLAIENNIKPFHLGESFNKIYKTIFLERKKIPKSDPMNYVYKIILNSAYGLSKEKNGYLYDPLFTYSITINGQLTILMLAEKLLQDIPNIVFYQMNTDGVSVGYNPIYTDKVKEILKWFNQVTRLEIEEAFYKELIIRDVNNYIGVYSQEGKEAKKKGVFETLFDSKGKRVIEHHKNCSFNIVPLATEQYFVNGKDYRQTILEHTEIYDFLGAVKKKSDFNLNLLSDEDATECQQRVTRFYPSRNGKKFVKDFHDGRRVGILKDWKVTAANKITEEVKKEILNNIDYNFYIREVEKLVSEIEGEKNGLTIKYEL